MRLTPAIFVTRETVVGYFGFCDFARAAKVHRWPFFFETIHGSRGLALTLNSAALTPLLHSLPEPSPWDDVRRIYRRICVLRATGKIDDAAELEHGEYARAVSVARIAASGEDEAAILAVEAEHVANAGVLAELLAPLLAEHLRMDPRPTASRTPLSAPVPVEKPKPVHAARPPAPAVPSITDLIDGMLAQES